jgi:hypothetical protein
MAVSKRKQKQRHLILPGTTLINFRGFGFIRDDGELEAHYQMVRDPGFVIVGRTKVDNYHLVEIGQYENFDFENPVWRKAVLHLTIDTGTGTTRVDVIFIELGLGEINHFQVHDPRGRRSRLVYKTNYHPPKGWRKRT